MNKKIISVIMCAFCLITLTGCHPSEKDKVELIAKTKPGSSIYQIGILGDRWSPIVKPYIVLKRDPNQVPEYMQEISIKISTKKVNGQFEIKPIIKSEEQLRILCGRARMVQTPDRNFYKLECPGGGLYQENNYKILFFFYQELLRIFDFPG